MIALTRTNFAGSFLFAAATALLSSPGQAAAQSSLTTYRAGLWSANYTMGFLVVAPIQQQFDPNAINALMAGQNAASGGLSPRQQSIRFRFIAQTTGTGFLSQPLQVVTQFGSGGQNGTLGSGSNGVANLNPNSGASGVAGGAAAGVDLAAQTNLLHQPAGVQINSLFNNPIGLPFGLNANQNNFGGGINAGGGGGFGGGFPGVGFPGVGFGGGFQNGGYGY
jgi:hypothetical protein